MENSNIRGVTATDLPFLKDVVDSSGLFPGELLGDMLTPSLNDKDSPDVWLTYEEEQPLALAYLAPERMTSGTWNLFLIAVHGDHQGSGIGSKLMRHVEERLKSQGERILIVETSDLKEFNLTRKFYDGLGYAREAHIREFYEPGEGKVVFWKKLN